MKLIELQQLGVVCCWVWVGRSGKLTEHWVTVPVGYCRFVPAQNVRPQGCILLLGDLVQYSTPSRLEGKKLNTMYICRKSMEIISFVDLGAGPFSLHCMHYM